MQKMTKWNQIDGRRVRVRAYVFAWKFYASASIRRILEQ